MMRCLVQPVLLCHPPLQASRMVECQAVHAATAPVERSARAFQLLRLLRGSRGEAAQFAAAVIGSPARQLPVRLLAGPYLGCQRSSTA